MELSRCCNKRLQRIEESSHLIPDNSSDGIVYSTYRCSKCGLVYCLHKKKAHLDEPDEWD